MPWILIDPYSDRVLVASVLFWYLPCLGLHTLCTYGTICRASVSSRDWEVGTHRRAGAVTAGGAGDDRMGRRGQGKDQQDDATEGGAL